jgi:hypothetical protein
MSRVMPALLTSTCRPPCLTMVDQRFGGGGVVDVQHRAAAARGGRQRRADAGRRRRRWWRCRSPSVAARGQFQRNGAPMPREAPVTRATWPSNLVSLMTAALDFGQCGGSYSAAPVSSASMRLTMPASTLPGARIRHRGDARALMARTHSTQRTGPKAWRYRASRMPVGIVPTATSMLLMTGICGTSSSMSMSLQRRPQLLGRRLHQAGMERRRHRQRQRPLGARRLEHFAGLFHRRLAASNHGLRTGR